MLGAVPQAAADQLAVELALIGKDVLAAQKRDVANRTGALEAGLSVQVLVDALRVRVGLIGKKTKLFYGRIVERGRRAQVVLAKRGGRGGRRSQAVAATYSMRVSRLAPRPFVHVDRPELRAEQRLASFWSEVLTNVGAGGR
jgi:hypothetical protein